ncbi:30S ribosomal protein S18 [Patescibacteria group bacterium]|nr:MAG: 30S ribosomal protein S18 [Patescibacteria group bacterium]
MTTMPSLPKFVDYKNVAYLRTFMTPHARIQGSRRTNVPASHQRKIEEAIKRARFMGLLPYIAR